VKRKEQRPAQAASTGELPPEPPGQEARGDVRDLPPHLRGAMRGDQGFVEAGVPPPKKPR
jgi:hypothetical protein